MTRRAAIFPFLITLVLAGCGTAPEPSAQTDWLHVLDRKRDATSPAAGPRQKQLYADTLSVFVTRYPEHGRAREVYRRIQLEFARDLALLGRHQDAIRLYRSILAADPRSEDARRGLAESIAHLAVTREKLLSLEKGMSKSEVARRLGKPVPGWTERRDERSPAIEAWYYRKTDGSVAAVYFRDGQLFAAESSSSARQVTMSSGS